MHNLNKVRIEALTEKWLKTEPIVPRQADGFYYKRPWEMSRPYFRGRGEGGIFFITVREPRVGRTCQSYRVLVSRLCYGRHVPCESYGPKAKPKCNDIVF